MQKFATKEYVDKRIASSIGMFMENFDDKFKILQEGINTVIERLDRLTLENAQDHQGIINRLIALEIDR